ncbi:MAG: hypothetical protein QCI82_04680 [Candidatus Thermoplasmatota archaeon]|nr:hypothetical protein [Candidatus Thermoplasmatota archaeon]
MRFLAIIVAIIALFANLGIVLTGVVIFGDDHGNGPGGGGGDSIVSIEGPSSLTVPEMMIGDQAKYTYKLFAQMFYENRTSGEWQRYTLTGEGEFLQYIDEPETVKDGFLKSHMSIKTVYSTRANFQMRIEGNDKDTVVIPGNIEVDRSDFVNLLDGHQLMATNSGSLSINGLGSSFGNIPADVSYIADLRTYPDPNADAAVSMDDAIYGSGQVLYKSSKGQYIPPASSQETSWIYDWQVDGAYRVGEHDTYLINVTTRFWDFFNFERSIYVSGDSPFYIKGNTRSNTSFSDEDETFYIVLEFGMDLYPGDRSLIRGDRAISWGDASNDEGYVDRHGGGEFAEWDIAPRDGSAVDRSSFSGWTLNQAMDFALDRSVELNAFMDEYGSKGSIVIEDSVFNISKEDRLGRNTTQWWNLTFSLVASGEEARDHYRETEEWPEWRYRILVARSVDQKLSGSVVSTFISRDEGDERHGRTRGYLDIDSMNLDREILTLTASERIIKLDADVRANAYTGNTLNEGVKYYYGIVGISRNAIPSLALVEQILGITTPGADNAFGMQYGEVWTTGSTFSAAVDANTGQLLYVTSVEGSQLAAVFGG